MSEDRPQPWFQKRVFQVLLIILLPAIVLGLYILTTRFAISKPRTVPPPSEAPPPFSP